uniref:Uncharacterized protein n=1 Tax=Phlebotomus papatasi TaxID=29031 RepID=A0A1B0GM52_PHLPP
MSKLCPEPNFLQTVTCWELFSVRVISYRRSNSDKGSLFECSEDRCEALDGHSSVWKTLGLPTGQSARAHKSFGPKLVEGQCGHDLGLPTGQKARAHKSFGTKLVERQCGHVLTQGFLPSK